jgi:hypothetical protein
MKADSPRSSCIVSRSTRAKARNAPIASSRPSSASKLASGSPNRSRAYEALSPLRSPSKRFSRPSACCGIGRARFSPRSKAWLAPRRNAFDTRQGLGLPGRNKGQPVHGPTEGRRAPLTSLLHKRVRSLAQCRQGGSRCPAFGASRDFAGLGPGGRQAPHTGSRLDADLTKPASVEAIEALLRSVR